MGNGSCAQAFLLIESNVYLLVNHNIQSSCKSHKTAGVLVSPNLLQIAAKILMHLSVLHYVDLR